MLFHTWPFLIFMLIVLPVFFALRKTRLWIPWLLAASYFFYAWWNPYYLLLVIYSTALDYLLVTLMDHCPPREAPETIGASQQVAEGAENPARGKWWRLKSPPRHDSAGAIDVES